MKKLVFSLMACVCLIFTSCNTVLDEARVDNTEYGTVCISSGSMENRALELDTIKFANVKISGDGITKGFEPYDEADVSEGYGTFKIEKVPVGKNRIVTVTALDKSKAEISKLTMRAIVDVEKDKASTVVVDWESTAVGNVFAALYEKGKKPLANYDKDAIVSAASGSTNSFLIDTAAIANDCEGVLKEPVYYVLKPASLNFKTSETSSYKIQVCDPLSKVVTTSAASGTVSNVAPGSWKVKFIGSEGTKEKTVSFTSGKASEVSFEAQVTDRIILHAYNYTHLWAWNGNNSSENYTGGSWPGVKMNQEGTTNWYTYTLDVTTSMVIFSNGGSGQTSDMTRNAGEWWYKDGIWYDDDPSDSEAPTISSFVCDAKDKDSVSGVVTFTIEASDNKKLKSAEVLINGNKYKTFNFSELNSELNFEWDSRTYKNANYVISVTVSDETGNRSESKEISLTTNNENLPPVAKITGSGKVGKGTEKTYKATSSYDPNGKVTSYKWEVSGGATIKSGASQDTVVVAFPDSETTCTITLTVADDNDATAQAVKEVEVSDKTSTIDFREEQIYFVITTRFYDGDLSNNVHCWDENAATPDNDPSWRGDFKGLIEKLDYIKALGFSAIWITPVVENSSGIDYHGYHASDFSKVDPRYAKTGQDSMVAYQELIDACHAKGIKVIQDIVLNHTGNFGEAGLFKMFDTSKTSITADKRTNFVELDPNGGYGYEALKKALGGKSYDSLKGSVQYDTRINAMKEDSNDTDFIYHHCKTIDWNSENVQLGQMAGDCVDLNTENPKVYNYLIDCYNNYIDMGVDGFRIDTVKHISRLTFNNTFIPAFKERGGDDFFIFGETCARYRGRWNEGVPAISPSFYTWKETESFAWSDTDHKVNSVSATSHFTKYRSGFNPPHSGTPNHLLNGNEYHKPDWSKRSGLDQIDFPMHWAFRDAAEAFNTAVNTNDPDFNDATFNVTYVDSHDYAPDNAPEGQRFAGNWPDKLNLLFTFRGIPCIYYGSEIEFKKGKPIDPANDRTSLEESGRAYLGTHLEGNVTATDYGEYTASGTVAQTLNHELAQHIIRLNKIRRAVPALQKGQYSTQGCSGNIAFKRRFVDTTTGEDSFVLVAINGGATFSNVPNGTYVDLVTGDKKSGSTISTGSIGQDNMRVYVLQNSTAEKYGATGKIGKSGTYLK